MKRANVLSWVITLVLAAGVVPATFAFGAQTQNPGMQQPPQRARQQPPRAQQVPPSMQQEPGPAKARTYFGKIVKTKSGKYALLTNPKAGKGYFWDDQKDAKKYVQKDVDITARLDASTSTLHVLSIKPAS